MRLPKTPLLALVALALVGGCGGDDSDPEPVTIAYQYRLEDDRDSVSTPLKEGRYDVRVVGDCSEHPIVLTEGGVFDAEHRIGDLIADGLNVGSDGRWRIRQPQGDEMPACEGVTLYPEGTDAPPVPATEPKPSTTTTTEAPPDTLPQVVEAWAEDHLEDIAKTHGSLTGMVNAAGEMVERGWDDQAQELCSVASGGINFVDDAEEAIEEFPGTVDLEGEWAAMLDETYSLFNRCADDPQTLLSAEAWSAADVSFSLVVLQALAEIDENVDQDHELVVGYDETREDYREGKRDELMTTALIEKSEGR